MKAFERNVVNALATAFENGTAEEALSAIEGGWELRVRVFLQGMVQRHLVTVCGKRTCWL
jgi:hypothetical protein